MTNLFTSITSTARLRNSIRSQFRCFSAAPTWTPDSSRDLSFAKTKPDEVKKVACLGVGIIGGGFVAEFLRNGFEVTAFDPSPHAEDNLRRLLDTAWPSCEALGLKEGACLSNLTLVTDDLAEALEGADCVQESVPENLEIKRNCFKAVDDILPAGVPVMSSISGSYFLADLQQACTKHPERFVVAHPFNPPYLIPLIELVGSDVTDPAVTEWAFQFYKSIGKFPLHCSQENPGYVGNRLQDALWREALHMLVSGEATFEEIDAAIVYGPGLRWPAMGPLLTFYLAGGPTGYEHFFDHFGPTLEQPWTRLDAPPISEEMKTLLVEGARRETEGRSMDELVAQRDACIASLLTAMKKHPRPVGFGGGLRASQSLQEEKNPEVANG